MKKYLLIFAAALTIIGCTKKPAEQAAENQEPQQEQAEAPEQEGEDNSYIDITALTPEGTELSLSQVVGKTDYVLLDFWASWCGPCRRFIPVLKEIYHMQPKRLEIISCSVDQEEAAWRAALSEEDMPWPQMREDEAHSCSDVYNVQFIPHTVLIDREGTIVGINLDESELERLLYPEDE